MEIEKAIFLDIDGVLSTLYEFNMTGHAKNYLHRYDIYPFSPRCVKVLNEVLTLTKAQIILSSDWRTFFTKEEIQDIFSINGVTEYPIAFTPDLSDQYPSKSLSDIRALEIQSFLKAHKLGQYVVVDDLNMSDAFGSHFIFCSKGLEGIREVGIRNKMIKALL